MATQVHPNCNIQPSGFTLTLWCHDSASGLGFTMVCHPSESTRLLTSQSPTWFLAFSCFTGVHLSGSTLVLQACNIALVHHSLAPLLWHLLSLPIHWLHHGQFSSQLLHGSPSLWLYHQVISSTGSTMVSSSATSSIGGLQHHCGLFLCRGLFFRWLSQGLLCSSVYPVLLSCRFFLFCFSFNTITLQLYPCFNSLLTSTTPWNWSK